MGPAVTRPTLLRAVELMICNSSNRSVLVTISELLLGISIVIQDTSIIIMIDSVVRGILPHALLSYFVGDKMAQLECQILITYIARTDKGLHADMLTQDTRVCYPSPLSTVLLSTS